MAAAGTRSIRIRFDGDATGLARTAKAAENGLQRFGRTIKDVAKGAASSFIGNIGADLVQRGVGAIKNFVGESITGARESVKIGKQTEAVIRSTKGAANVSAKAVGDYATKLSNLTGVDDEVIQSGQNMLLTFTNVKNGVGRGNDIFNRATATLTDMSAALGVEPRKAAIQLGKALNDPIKGVSALSRVGVTFTEGQKKQIKTLVDSGRTMDAQKIILNELGKEFGGSAAAQSTAADKAKISFGNLQEQVGGYLLPVIDKLSSWLSTKVLPRLADLASKYGPKAVTLITRLAHRVQELAEKYGPPTIAFLGDLVDKVKAVATVVGPKLVAILKQVADKGGKVIAWAKENREILEPLAVAILAGVAAWKAYIAVTQGIAAVKAAVAGLRSGIVLMNAAMSANPVGIVIVALALLAVGLVYAWKKSETFRVVVIAVFKAVANFVLGSVENILGAVKGVFDALSNIPGPMGRMFKRAAGGVQTAIDKVHNLRTAVNNLPDGHTIDVKVRVHQSVVKAMGATEIVVPPFLRPRAAGGPVTGGRPYLVGEKGPELFTPAQSGRISTANDTAAAMGAAGPLVIENHIEIGGEVVRVTRHEIDGDKRRTRRAVLSGVGGAA